MDNTKFEILREKQEEIRKIDAILNDQNLKFIIKVRDIKNNNWLRKDFYF